MTGYWGALVASRCPPIRTCTSLPPRDSAASTRPPKRPRAALAREERGCSARHAARAPPFGRRRLAPRRALRPLRLRRGLADGYSTLTTGSTFDTSRFSHSSRPQSSRSCSSRSPLRSCSERRLRLRGAIHRSAPGVGRRPQGSCSSVSGAGPRSRSAPRSSDCSSCSLSACSSGGPHRRPDLRTASRRMVGSTRTRHRGGGLSIVAALVVLPPALLSWRHPSATYALDRAPHVYPDALPGIAVGLALVFFGARSAGASIRALGS